MISFILHFQTILPHGVINTMKITDKQVSKAIKELGFDIDDKKDSTEFVYKTLRENESSDMHEITITIRENAKVAYQLPLSEIPQPSSDIGELETTKI